MNKKIKFDDVKDKYIEFFNKKGKSLTSSNGKKLPIDQKILKERKTTLWSENIICLSVNGLVLGYFRHEDNQFTLSGFAINDLYLKDCKNALLTKKFITSEQIKQLQEFIKQLKP